VGLEQERSRIIEWGLGETVDRLMAGGLVTPKVIAHKMDADPEVRGIVGAQVIRPKDIQVYLAHRNAKKEDALAKSLVHSQDGRALIESARATVAWLVEQVELLKPLVPQVLEDFNEERERWANTAETPKFDSEGNRIQTFYPEAQLRSMEKVLRLVKDIAESVKGDEKMQALVRAGTANFINGISQQEMFDTIVGCMEHLECRSCGFKSFGRDDAGRAFARYRSRKAVEANPVDA
jgi:hypothetical protein